MSIEFYEVGGCVRDGILGVPTKDVDYTVTAPSYTAMSEHLDKLGFEIFVESPQYLTVRARFPRGSTHFAGRDITGLTADFVLARKEGQYTDGRHPDLVEPGTIYDDLNRRDFTMNAIAKDAEGNLIDPHNGFRDIQNRYIKAVGDPRDRIIKEDALRALRAIRFSVVKDFTIDPALMRVLVSEELPALLQSVSVERRREEVLKMFKHDTVASMEMFIGNLPYAFTEAVFSDGLWLTPTLKGNN